MSQKINNKSGSVFHFSCQFTKKERKQHKSKYKKKSPILLEHRQTSIIAIYFNKIKDKKLKLRCTQHYYVKIYVKNLLLCNHLLTNLKE